MSRIRRIPLRTRACMLTLLSIWVLVGADPLSSSADPTLGQLNQQLGAAHARQSSLQGSLSGLSRLVSSLQSQIGLVQTREAAVSAELVRDQSRLAQTATAAQLEHARLMRLRGQLARARSLLAAQLVSRYESGTPDLVDVVLESHGFTDMLDRLQYLGDAEHQQQLVITVTRLARARATAAAVRLSRLEISDRQITDATALQMRALAGMNSLLQSRRASLASAEAVQRAALSASRSRVGSLQSQISRVEAAQAAPAPSAAGDALGPSGGWAIPYAIVLCESGGQNLPPNSAGASGYYQILPSTWKLFGGSGPAAYLASKAEQDAVAAHIWNGGAGVSNWVCAGIVGVH